MIARMWISTLLLVLGLQNVHLYPLAISNSNDEINGRALRDKLHLETLLQSIMGFGEENKNPIKAVPLHKEILLNIGSKPFVISVPAGEESNIEVHYDSEPLLDKFTTKMHQTTSPSTMIPTPPVVEQHTEGTYQMVSSTAINKDEGYSTLFPPITETVTYPTEEHYTTSPQPQAKFMDSTTEENVLAGITLIKGMEGLFFSTSHSPESTESVTYMGTETSHAPPDHTTTTPSKTMARTTLVHSNADAYTTESYYSPTITETTIYPPTETSKIIDSKENAEGSSSQQATDTTELVETTTPKEQVTEKQPTIDSEQPPTSTALFNTTSANGPVLFPKKRTELSRKDDDLELEGREDASYQVTTTVGEISTPTPEPTWSHSGEIQTTEMPHSEEESKETTPKLSLSPTIDYAPVLFPKSNRNLNVDQIQVTETTDPTTEHLKVTQFPEPLYNNELDHGDKVNRGVTSATMSHDTSTTHTFSEMTTHSESERENHTDVTAYNSSYEVSTEQMKRGFLDNEVEERDFSDSRLIEAGQEEDNGESVDNSNFNMIEYLRDSTIQSDNLKAWTSKDEDLNTLRRRSDVLIREDDDDPLVITFADNEVPQSPSHSRKGRASEPLAPEALFSQVMLATQVINTFVPHVTKQLINITENTREHLTGMVHKLLPHEVQKIVQPLEGKPKCEDQAKRVKRSAEQGPVAEDFHKKIEKNGVALEEPEKESPGMKSQYHRAERLSRKEETRTQNSAKSPEEKVTEFQSHQRNEDQAPAPQRKIRRHAFPAFPAFPVYYDDCEYEEYGQRQENSKVKNDKTVTSSFKEEVIDDDDDDDDGGDFVETPRLLNEDRVL